MTNGLILIDLWFTGLLSDSIIENRPADLRHHPFGIDYDVISFQ